MIRLITAVAEYISIGIRKRADSVKMFDIVRDLIFCNINLRAYWMEKILSPLNYLSFSGRKEINLE